MWWLWVTTAAAGVGDDLAALAPLLHAVVEQHAAAGCALRPLSLPASPAETAEAEAAAIEQVRSTLSRWQTTVEGCTAPGAEPRYRFRSFSPETDAEASRWLRQQGHPEAARAWRALSAETWSGYSPAGRGCRCVGEPAASTPILYGYPSRRAEAMAALGMVRLGGCVVSEDSPMVSCPYGCVPARRGLPGREIEMVSFETGAADLHVAGPPRQVKALSPEPIDGLTACGAGSYTGAVSDGAWTLRCRGDVDCSCVGSWLTEHVSTEEPWRATGWISD